MSSGVYAILDRTTFKRYVGCSVNIDIRWEQHVRMLEEQRHSNRLLQQAYNTNPDNFSFIILEYTFPQETRKREQVWFDRMMRHYDLFNLDLRYPENESTGAT
jgi:group I intron endonuclease